MVDLYVLTYNNNILIVHTHIFMLCIKSINFSPPISHEQLGSNF